jgi:hypothetical protein
MTDNHGESFHPPSEELLSRVLSSIGDLQHRRAFYIQLRNPLWIERLDERHAFDNPPMPVQQPDGTWRRRPWPEGEYLARMAPLRPEQVARIFSRYLGHVDPDVRRLVLSAAGQMPAAIAATLIDGIRRFFETPTWFDPDQLVNLIRLLADGGESAKAARLAEAIFRPQRAPVTDEGTERHPSARHDVRAGLEPYWYAQTLPAVVDALKPHDAPLLTRLTAWLEAYQIAVGEYDPANRSDMSSMWRPSIEPHEQNWNADSIGNALVDAVRDLAVTQLREGRPAAEVVATLQRGGQPLLTRLAMAVLARAADERANDDDTLIPGAAVLLLEPAHLDTNYRHEYSELAIAVLPRLDADALDQFEQLVLGGPPVSDEDLRTMLAGIASHLVSLPGGPAPGSEQEASEAMEGRGPEESDQGLADVDVAAAAPDVDAYRRRWRLRLLSAIGRSALTPRLQEVLDVLQAQFGQPEHPEFPSYHSAMWVGPTSPVSPDELAAMPVPELLEHLRTWIPQPGVIFGPSIEGQARALEQVVARDPASLAEHAPEFPGLPVAYIRGLLRGLEVAIESGRSFAWGPVLELCAYVATRSDSAAGTAGNADDSDLRSAQLQMANLLSRGCLTSAWSTADASAALSALRALSHHWDPTAEHEQQYGGSNMDPLTMSLNTVRPAALRALLTLLGSDAARPVQAEILHVLDSRLGFARDNSLAVAAVFGEKIAQMLLADRDWFLARVERLLGPSDTPVTGENAPYIDTVWSVFLSTHRPHPQLVNDLRPYFMRAVHDQGSERERTEGWRSERGQRQRLGDNLLILVVGGAIDEDDPLIRAFFEDTPSGLRAEVVGHLGWLLMHQSPDEAVFARARSLVDHRAQLMRSGESEGDLDEFTWWVKSGRFDPAWWLPLLVQATKSPSYDPRGTMGKDLAEVAASYPGLTLEVFKQLLALPGEGWKNFSLVENAPPILASALEADNPQLRSEAQQIMDQLGRDGFLDLADAVQAHRTQDRSVPRHN